MHHLILHSTALKSRNKEFKAVQQKKRKKIAIYI